MSLQNFLGYSDHTRP